MILENTIKQASQLLKNKNIISHELDAQVILSDIMGVTRDFFITNSHIKVSKNTIKKFNYAIRRRIKREPVAYIIGKKEFWSQDFVVNQTTLVPRPETELLIYKVIDFFKNKRINILDIGTGSGCILLSILKELVHSRGIGIDISTKAIRAAKKNSRNLNLAHRSKFEVFDLNKFGQGKYDLIISNPPYISSKYIKNLSKDIKTRLQSINGQINGLINMLDEDTDPDKILIQFKAAQKGLDKAYFLLLDVTYRKALAIKISETVEACPGDCGNEDRIEFIRKQFPDLELDTLTSQMKEIDALRKRIDGNDLDKDGSS